MEINLIIDLEPEIYSKELKKAIRNFTDQIMSKLKCTEPLQDSYTVLHNIRVSIGERLRDISVVRNVLMLKIDKYTETEGVSLSYNQFPSHLPKIENLISLYQKADFNPDGYATFDYRYSATHGKHKYPHMFHAEEPFDQLHMIKKDYCYFKEIMPDKIPTLYQSLEKTIEVLEKEAAIIEKEISSIPEFAKKASEFTKMTFRDEGYYDKQKVLRAIYLQEEFKRKDRVIPILQKMKLVYETAINIFAGISKEYDKRILPMAIKSWLSSVNFKKSAY